MRSMHKLLVSFVAFTVMFTAATIMLPQKAAALSGSDFNASRIIDDSIFFNSGTMNTGDIQNFLNSKLSSCRSGYTCLKDYQQGIPNVAANSYCGGISGGTKSAADIIFNVARACGINPQSLIVTLQKEQGLITDDWPTPTQYQIAMGYGCPDTAACDSEYYGFFNQVYNAGKQFKRYVAQPGSFNYAAGRTSYVLYNPNSSCGGTNLTLQNGATAALYNYTPYQPNPAALSVVSDASAGGTVNCGAYGNRNFWWFFNKWFGPTNSEGFTRIKSEDPNDLRQWVMYGTIKQHIPDSQTIYAWNLQNTPLITVSVGYLNSVATGPNLERLVRLNGSNGLLYFVDNGKRYAVTSQDLLNSWGLNNMVTSYVNSGLYNNLADGGYLSYAARANGSGTIYMTDGVNGSNQRILRPYQNETVFRAWEGDTAFFTDVSSDFFDAMNDAVGSTLVSTKTSYNGNEYQIVNATKYSQPASHASFYPGTANAISAATFNRLYYGGHISHLIRASSQPTVYLMDGAQKHAIASGSVLEAWRPPGSAITIVNSNYVSLLSTGTAITSYTANNGSQLFLMNGYKLAVPSALDSAYRNAYTPQTVSTALTNLYTLGATTLTGFLRGVNTPQVYLLDSSGKKRHIDSGDKATLYGAYSSGIIVLSDNAVDLISAAPGPQLFVTNGTTEYLMENGTKRPISGSVKTDWGITSPQSYTDGTLDRFPTGSAMTNELRDGNYYFLIREGKAFLTVDPNIAEVWDIHNAPATNRTLIANQLGYSMLTRFVNSSTDHRTFIVERGDWYNLSSTQFANLGGVGAPVMLLNPSNAPNSITDWTSVVVKDHNSKNYVIDGGTKRGFADPYIQSWWTNNGSITVPSTTNGFLNLLPNNANIERAIKGSSPAVYSAENVTKRHILYSDTFNRLYAPFAPVSDALINVLTTGSNIE